MIRNILFDLGGVLIDLDVKRSIGAFTTLMADKTDDGHDCPITAMDLLGGGESDLVKRYQTGRVTSDEFFRTIASVCKPGTTRADLVHAWRAMLLDLPQRRIEMIRRLRQAGYTVYILSNINEDHVLWTMDHFRAWGLRVAGHDGVKAENADINRAFFSNEMGVAKPDIRCYETVIRETGIAPGETLYIDDLAQNIDAGRSVGMVCMQALGDEWMPEAEKLIQSQL